MMYEKYDAFTPGLYGGGGEYAPQAGFGWTNGVALELIEARHGSASPSLSLP
jgi:alpha,alpha-trehalase